MANSQQLIEWLLFNADRLNLQIDQLTWLQDEFPNYTDLRVQITVEHQTHTGFASATSQDLALTKAAAEALERAVCREHGFPTTNGFAAHLTEEEARQAARNELIERDRILCHFYANQPFPSLQHNGMDSSLFSFVRKWYQDRDLEFRLFELEPRGVLFVADGRRRLNEKFGFVLGAGRKGTLEESIESAVFEATRQLAHILARPKTPSKNLQEFNMIKVPSFRDHGELALNLDYASQIAHLFYGAPKEKLKPLKEGDLHVSILKSRLAELQGCPLFFAKAASSFVQDIFLGSPTTDHINLQRISEFVGFEVSFDQILNLPHPFS